MCAVENYRIINFNKISKYFNDIVSNNENNPNPFSPFVIC